MAIVTVALAGTPEAATADFVCDGVDDNIEIAAAIAQLVALGGGTLQMAAGIYSTSRPIIVEHDNVAIVGAAGQSTFIRPAANWVSISTAGGAEATGVVTFVGVNNFAARNLVVESTVLPMNGIIAIPDGPTGTGQVSTNGVFDNNIVRMAQAHTYSIWSLLSTGMTITNNFVDGGATLNNANASQEGIEIFGGDNILISGNTLLNIGNAAINLVTISGTVAGSDLSNIQILNNTIDASRIGVFLGSTYSTVHGSANISNIEIDGNIITNGFEGGIFVEMQDGILSDPTLLDTLTITNNQIEVLSNPDQDFITFGLYFDGKNDDGLTISSNVNITNNILDLTSTTAILPPPTRISSTNSRFVIFYNYEDVNFSDNILNSDLENVISSAVSTFLSDDVEIRRNEVTGFLGFGIEVSNSSNIVIDDNNLIDWGGFVDYFAILIASSSNVIVSANDVESPANFQGPIAANIFSTNVSFTANRIIADHDFSIAGSNYRDLLLTNGGIIAVGSSAVNYLEGNALANTLDGGAGADTLAGLGGDDVYIVDDAGDVVVEAAGGGSDEVRASISYTLGAGVEVEKLVTTNAAGTAAINLTGNALVQEITGNTGANALDGGAGADVLRGLGGDDLYLIDDAGDQIIEAVGNGNDEARTSISYTLSADIHVEKLATTNAAGTGAINLTANALTLELVGNAGVNILTGNALANTLDGGAGVDTLAGLGGDDVYIVDDATDVIVEAAGEGSDEIRASVSYTLGTGVEAEKLSTTNAAASASINLTGNALAQELTGNAGANMLDGSAGADSLRGLGGDDIYIIDDAADVVVEAAGGGTDEVRSSVSYVLGADAHAEQLVASNSAGTLAIDLTGNAHVLAIVGNAGVNILTGGSGNNTLDGGLGADTLVGLGGNDIYIVDDTGDVVTEAVDEGNDELRASISFVLGSGVHVEKLSTSNAAGIGAVNLTGNALVQDIIGNAGANIFDGGGGNDTLRGLGGDDLYLIDNSGVTVIEAADNGYDTLSTSVSYTLGIGISAELLKLRDAASANALNLTGNELANRLEGNAGINILNGGAGIDVLQGFGGNDIYYLDNVADVIIEGSDEGLSDVAYSAVSYTLGAAVNVEFLSTITHAATTAINLTGNALRNHLIGNAGANILEGGGASIGRDTMQGLGGDDIYIIRQGNEIIEEAVGGGSDEVRTHVNFALASSVQVEKISAADAAAITGLTLTGNALVQEITGNAGADTLDGGAGADVLRGLGGDDHYIIDDLGDQIVEVSGEGFDDARTGISYTLGTGVHVEKLWVSNATATTALNLTGNELVQEVVGNAGANILDGGAAADVLRGLGGDDIYLVDDAADEVIEAIGDGTDEVRASVSFALGVGSHVEKLATTDAGGTAAINLTGNAFVQTVTGNAGANILDGGAGADILSGLGGDDVYLIDDAADQISELLNEGADEARALVSYGLGVDVHVEKLSAIDAVGLAAINLTGNAYDQRITGNAGANILDGGGGVDVLAGLGGDDVYRVDSANVTLIEAADSGNDSVQTSVDYTLAAGVSVEFLRARDAAATAALILSGNAFNQEIIGNAGANTLDGGGGADILRGLGGDDIYRVDSLSDQILENADEGFDEARATSSYGIASGSHVEKLFLANANGTDQFNLTGNEFAQALTGNAGANILDGGAGADTLSGLGGDDIYIVDDAGDAVVETANEGSDEVRASVSYALATGVSAERLVTTNAAATGAINLTGNALVQELTGNAGANILDGGGGSDILRGLGGDDVYVIDNAGVTIIEVAGAGNDTLSTSISYTLGTSLSIEVLKLKDAVAIAALNLTGNELANRLEGNAGVNVLNGGAGIDVLQGLGGNDIYYLDNAADQIIEGSDEGTSDVAYSSVSYTLGAGSAVEILSTITHAATIAINLTGNTLRNQLIGNAGGNIFDGGGASNGRDVLQGLGGDDIYIVRQGDEVIYELAGGGTDEVRSAVNFTLAATVQIERIATIDATATTALTLRGNEHAQDITGNAGANILDGGAGADILRGLDGNDLYIIDNIGDQIIEISANGSDEARTSVSYTLASDAHVEKLATSNADGTAAINLTGNAHVLELTGNAGVNTLTGGAGSNTLDGGAGADTLIGLGGDDAYLVDNAGDVVSETAGEGVDEVRASVSYTLGAGVEVERLVTGNSAGTGAFNLTGNALAQELVGNAGANLLDGGAGADTLRGLGGNDVYVVDDAGDVVIEAANEGIDEVRASVSYALGADVHVERLATDNIAGTTALNLTGNAHVLELTGNAGVNILTGGAGNTILDGGVGADSLVGLGGDDIYIVDDAGDAVVEAANEGSDEVRTSVSYALGAGVNAERLMTTNAAGTGAISLTGNALVQELTGNAGVNILDGGGGSDTLRGLGGDDVYLIDNAGVTIIEAAGAGNDTLATSISYTLGTGLSIELLKLKDAAATTALNLTGNELANRIEGNAGVNVLNGGEGADVLQGLGGNDIYFLDHVADQIIEGSEEGTNDVAYSAVNYTLGNGAGVEVLSTITHAATTAINLTGNALRNQLIGNAGSNILDGGGASNGRDTLQGLGGDDIYIIRKGDEIIYESAGGGTDEVRSAVNYTLTATVNVERISTIDAGAVTALTLRGNELAQDITGNAGVNILDGGAGADILRGLEGNDALFGGSGTDIAKYRGLRAQYSIITGSGSVQIVDNDVVLDGDDGTDTLVGVEFAEFKDGEQVGLMSPIILDLDGQGVETLSASESHSRFDMDGDGIGDDSSWFGGTEGLLVLDRDGNGTLSNAGEFSFVGDVEGARSDLEGLRAHDSNGDGELSALDARFADFMVWADRDGDGVVDNGEMITLAEAGVASINLTGEAVNAVTGLGDVAVVNRGSYTRTDGSKMEFLDVALTYNIGRNAADNNMPQMVSVNADADTAVALLKTAPLKAPTVEIAALMADGGFDPAPIQNANLPATTARLDMANLSDAAISLLLQINQAMASFAPGSGEADKSGATATVKPVDYFA